MVRNETQPTRLSHNQMAELFQTSIPNVSMHIRNVFAEGELQPGSVVKEFLTTATDGKKYQTKFYSLDVHDRASAARPNVGLTNWQGVKPTKGEAAIAKNFLTGEELEALNRIVNAYLDRIGISILNH